MDPFLSQWKCIINQHLTSGIYSKFYKRRKRGQDVHYLQNRIWEFIKGPTIKNTKVKFQNYILCRKYNNIIGRSIVIKNQIRGWRGALIQEEEVMKSYMEVYYLQPILKTWRDSGEHREERTDHWELKDWVRMVAGQTSIVGGLAKTNGAWKPDETH